MSTFVLTPSLTLNTQVDHAKHFVIVGAGGNGGYLIRDAIRMISLQNKRLKLAGRAEHAVTIIDADDVEDKNLNRQNFLRNDIGKQKAQVMADRYGRAFGVEIQFVDEYLTTPAMLQKIVKSQGGIPVIIGCVDNNKTRKIIHDWYQKQNNVFWIDAGNEEWGGQVVCGYKYSTKPVQEMAKSPTLFSVPCVTDLYPEILEAQDKLPTELSCAERAVSNPQNIFTNMTAATLMLGFVNTILNANGAQGEGLKHHAVAFNARVSSFTTRLNQMSNLIVEPKPEPAVEPVAEVAEVKAPVKKKAAKKKVETTEVQAETVTEAPAEVEAQAVEVAAE